MSEFKLSAVSNALAALQQRVMWFGAGALVVGFVGFGGYAVSASSPNTSSTSSTLVSKEASAIADAIRKEAEDCATGTKPGSIGASIADALKIHTELASATPVVENLFAASADCFAGLGSMFDLSYSIPSLSSIMATAEQAVVKFAQKKVCTAVNQVRTMVTAPINQSIAKVGTMSSIGDLNGLTNGLARQGMMQLDPSLGSEYRGAGGQQGTYTIDVNPFSAAQTNFSGAAPTTSARTSSAVQAPVTTYSSTVPSTSGTASAPAAASQEGGWTSNLMNLFN